MNRLALGPQRSITLLLATLVIGGLVGCSGADANSGVDASTAADPLAVGDVTGVSVSPRNVWGRGRALRALPLGDGSTTVVTTTGVYRVDMPDRQPDLQLEQFQSNVEINAVAMSADSSTLAVSTVSPATVRVYDLDGGTPVKPIVAPDGAVVTSLALDDSGVEVTVDTTLGPFRSTSGAAFAAVLDEAAVGQTARLPDGTLITPLRDAGELATERDGRVERLPFSLGEGATLVDAKSSPDGSVMALTVGAGDDLDRRDQIVVIDPTTFVERAVIDVGRMLEPKQWTVTDAMVVVSEGLSLSAWQLDGQPLADRNPVERDIVELVAHGDETLTVHSDGALLRWGGSPLHAAVVDDGGFSLAAIEVDRSGATATAVDRLGLISTWRIADGAPVSIDDRFRRGEATGVAIDGDASHVGIVTSSGEVALLDDTLQTEWTFGARNEPVRVDSIAFGNGDQTWLAAGLAERLRESAFDDTVTVWDPELQQQKYQAGGEGEDVPGCAFFLARVRFNPAGTLLATSSHDFSVVVLDAATGETIESIPGTNTVLDLTFSADGSMLVIAYDDGRVDVRDTTDFAQVADERRAAGGYFAMVPIPGTTQMAVTDITGAISIVDIVTGAPVMAMANSTLRTSTLAVSHDGALLAAPVGSGEIGVWSTKTGAQLAVVAGHTGAVTGLAFAVDDAWLASSSTDGTARTWGITRDAL